MILNEDSSPFGVLSYGRIVKDAELVSDGYVGFRVFWERYWVSILVAALAIVLILSWLRRLLFGRPRVIVQEQSKGRAR